MGKEKMKNLCEEYLTKYSLDNSGNRFWKDCSGEDIHVERPIWKTPTKAAKSSISPPGAPLKAPPRIVRYY